MNKNGISCHNCNPSAIYGGFFDGKLNFISRIGKSDLTKYMTESAVYKLINEIEEIFNKFNMAAEVYLSNIDKELEWMKKIVVAGAKLLVIL